MGSRKCAFPVFLELDSLERNQSRCTLVSSVPGRRFLVVAWLEGCGFGVQSLWFRYSGNAA